MQIIENDQFKAEIDEHGAQLTHLFNKSEGFDYIWNDDLWPKHAPVLFPAIGRSEKDAYFYNNQEYEMPQHGFVADQDFKVEKNTGNCLILSLTDNEITRKYYPFAFKLTIIFSLNMTGITFKFNVENIDSKALSFSLGSHPAFNVPINGEGTFDDYQIDFEPSGLTLKQFEIVKTPNPYRDGKIIKLSAANGSHINLNHEMFENGLIIIENDGIQGVLLSSSKTKHSIYLSLDDFRYVCLWTKEGANAPFLCIEPFAGLPDIAGHEVELMDKEANTQLQPGQKKAFEYMITLR
ncbi:aldose 1-epimerase family protein [Limosilactobacillus mucosae]|uniref:aldose 1-epimerase family protein n=1 Tax=Limosilactobacillus mucosae TaxID=97478 RepID=UPI00233ED891|nr:aldose 1-epimerase family protein [Limosilactobacillus mucosae]MDC2839460.1 aldose 1-epimerase family protein [Limosilactobacillus mucosae]